MPDMKSLMGAAMKGSSVCTLPSEEILQKISFKSSYPKSLNKLDITDELITCVATDVQVYESVLPTLIDLSNIPCRVKTIDSIYRKLERHPDAKAQQVFNDILGLRLVVDSYPDAYPDYFRVVDMRNGKKHDDGYRGVHLYYKLDNFHYTIEIQLWSKYDNIYNSWMHNYGYKTIDSDILLKVYDKYKAGLIASFDEYVLEVNKYV